MMLLILGAIVLTLTWPLSEPSFTTFVLPVCIMAVGIVFTVSVTANGALAAFSDRAGLAVAIYWGGESLIVSLLGTAAVVGMGGDTAWPLVTFTSVLAVVVLFLTRTSRMACR